MKTITKTSSTAAAALVALALAVLPGLTLDGLNENGLDLNSPRALREVAAAADFLGTCKLLCTTRSRATTTLVGELAADASGLHEVGSGAVLAAAVALNVRWVPIEGTPHARLAVRPPPPWLKPTVEHVEQALRRCAGPVDGQALAELVSHQCAGRGFRPPAKLVEASIALAITEGVATKLRDGQVALVEQLAAA